MSIKHKTCMMERDSLTRLSRQDGHDTVEGTQNVASAWMAKEDNHTDAKMESIFKFIALLLAITLICPILLGAAPAKAQTESETEVTAKENTDE